ncbi:MAG TPA: HAD-IC family P-type ATPase, partial [Dermatophilaceae bacterium]|nr:HAD-IC family P-type ATPase [Dermatophilaceae bacterium]
PAIEGLARVDVVCADKTGTLTENGMRLAEIRELAEPPAGQGWVSPREVLAQLVATEPNPNASLHAVAEVVAAAEQRWTETHHQPFTSARKWSGSTFADHGSWVLGAPDVLAAEGSAARSDAEDIGATGLRVLLLGRGSVPVTDAEAPGAVDPVALVVLEQRVRPDAKDTLDYFGTQDVEVKVISGDNARSVGAVTSGLGVAGGADPLDARTLGRPECLDGQPPDDAFTDAVTRHTVFGRVTPDQKRAMVLALKSRGHTVAMTGDGVNDVLALKDADIGVAMGSGSPATRAVAQIVLLDNRFATLPHVVAEGRRVIGNIERVANLFLTKTVYSVLLALLVGVAQLPFPLQPVHVTITGWFTIGVPAFLLSLAPNHERARTGFVRRVLELALPSGLVVGIATFTTYLVCRAHGTDGPLAMQASTATLATVIVVAFWVLSVIARPYEWWKIALLVCSAAAYLLIFTWPLTQRLFLLDPGNAAMMRTGLLSGLVGALVVEVIWWIRTARRGEPRQWWADD